MLRFICSGVVLFLRFAFLFLGVIDNSIIPCTAITGVLTRSPHPSFAITLHCAGGSRVRSSGNMAFFIAWLTQLPCPVLNRATPTSLMGASWRPEQWNYLAGQLDVPVYAIRRTISKTGGNTPQYLHPRSLQTCKLTVIGTMSLEIATPSIIEYARRIARAAGVQFLPLHFDSPERGGKFVYADLLPDVIEDEVADAILDYFVDKTQEKSHKFSPQPLTTKFSNRYDI